MPPEEPRPAAASTPAKRGRKPSTIPRAARETQRKLNHSIIEKARRTKINTALATLRELVPQEYKAIKEGGEEKEDDEDSDAEDGDEQGASKGSGKAQQKKTGGGRAPKEYKLDILVRAVAFMEDLVVKVDSLEHQVHELEGKLNDKKRKRGALNDDDCEEADKERTNKTLGPRRDSLPSFSTLFGNSNFDIEMTAPSGSSASHLPSPPLSGRCFDPIRTTQLPPLLSLDPDVGGRSKQCPAPASAVLTPEDEKAASLLLGIRHSPQFAFGASAKTSPALVPSYELSAPASPDSLRHHRLNQPVWTREGGNVEPQTPGSMLGLQQGGAGRR